MNPRFLPLFVLLLSATFSGCLSPAARSAAPAGEGGGASTTTSAPAPEVASDAGPTTPPVIADGGGILPPRPDSERLGQETPYMALYGPDFSQRLSASESGGIEVPRGGRVDLALRMQRMTGLGDVIVEPGLQVRLIVVYLDAYGKLRYRHCDALTSAVKPEGYNVTFTGVDVSSGGQIEVFVVNPSPPGRAPTADFSATCVNFPDETNGNASFIGDLILAQDFLFVGTFQLMYSIDLPELL